MAGKTLIGGTAYTVGGGKVKVNGTNYSVTGGKTLIDGTVRSITFGRLPSVYQEVEYIDGNGNPWINPGLTTGTNWRALIDLMPTVRTVQCIVGANSGSGEQFLRTANGGLTGYLGGKSFNTGDGSLPQNTRHEVDFVAFSSGSYIKIDGVQVFTGGTSFFVGKPIYLYTSCQGGNTSPENNRFIGRMYRARFYQSSIDNLVRDFIPCYRKSDNVAGLYDLVNGVFYTNAGSGSFTVGPNV